MAEKPLRSASPSGSDHIGDEQRVEVDLGRRRFFYNLGWTDREIADAVGAPRTRISDWRNYHGLPVHKASNRGMLSGAEHSARLKMYHSCLNDSVIAERFGVTAAAISSWRRGQGLPSHYYDEAFKREQVKNAERTELYVAGLTDPYIAMAMGCCAHAIWEWRKRYGLKPNRPKRVKGSNTTSLHDRTFRKTFSRWSASTLSWAMEDSAGMISSPTTARRLGWRKWARR